jgi:hypothetical protein
MFRSRFAPAERRAVVDEVTGLFDEAARPRS